MTPSLAQTGPGIDMSTIEALMDQSLAENQYSVKTRMETRRLKVGFLSSQRIHQLEKQKKNQWRGALFGFFVHLFSQASQMLPLPAPGAGTLLSRTLEALQQINPFSKKSRDAEFEAEKISGRIQKEEFILARMRDYLKRMEENEDRVQSRLNNVLDFLERSQEAVLEI